jgi:hypothetical protein
MEALKEYGMIFISLIIFPGLWLAVFRRLEADGSQPAQCRYSHWENESKFVDRKCGRTA